MQKLTEFLFSPVSPIFKGTMTIDTDGLAFLIDIFSDAYQRAKLVNPKILDLNADWVKELEKFVFFVEEESKERVWYQIGYNTEQLHFKHHTEVLSSTKTEASDLFIHDFGKEAVFKPQTFPITLVLKFLLNYDFKNHFDDEDEYKLDVEKIKMFNIRDYNTEKDINISITELNYNIPF